MHGGVRGQRSLPAWAPTALLSVAAPIVVYDVATDRGVGEVPALLLGAIGPLLELAITAAWRRRLDEFSTVVLIFLALGVVTSLFLDDPRLLLLKESAITGLFGIVLLVTVPTHRPLMFLFGRRFATGGDPARVAWWNGPWPTWLSAPPRRAGTPLWPATLLVEAVAVVPSTTAGHATMVVVMLPCRRG